MVLKGLMFLIFSGMLAGCASSGGYERHGYYYDEQRDRIYEHRATFLGDGKLSMAYAIVYWDVLPREKEEEAEDRGMTTEVFYLWLRNNNTAPMTIDPDRLSLLTEQGKTMVLSPLTGETPTPLEAQTVQPGKIASGYVVFEIPEDIITSDQPGRLMYKGRGGILAVRYLQIEEMQKNEGLVLEREARYYAPVYPRAYWYPYYYPYPYYFFDLGFYYYFPHRYYYYVPTQPQRRPFNVPSPPETHRRFKR